MDSLVGALEHQDYPFASIVRDLRPTRDPSRSPVFQISCTFEKSHLREESGPAGFLFPSSKVVKEAGGIRQESFFIPPRTCRYDLEFIFEHSDQSIGGMICYCSQLFAGETMNVMAENFVALLDSLLTTPDVTIDDCAWTAVSDSHDADVASPVGKVFDLPKGQPGETVRLTSGDIARLPTCPTSDAPIAPTRPTSQGTILTEIGNRCRQCPDAPALSGDGLRLTYAQMAVMATRLASRLKSRGAGREQLVPVIGRRGPLSTVGILGVSLSGAAFLPIEVEQVGTTLRCTFGRSPAATPARGYA